MKIEKVIKELDEIMDYVMETMSTVRPLKSKIVRKILANPETRKEFLTQFHSGVDEIVIEVDGITHTFYSNKL